MDKTIVGMIGAVGALMAATPAMAAPAHPLTVDTVMQANSYADLLKPIPNALALLKASEAAGADIVQGPAHDGDALVQEVQFHHHHHHRYYRRRRHHHHHHRYYR